MAIKTTGYGFIPYLFTLWVYKRPAVCKEQRGCWTGTQTVQRQGRELELGLQKERAAKRCQMWPNETRSWPLCLRRGPPWSKQARKQCFAARPRACRASSLRAKTRAASRPSCATRSRCRGGSLQNYVPDESCTSVSRDYDVLGPVAKAWDQMRVQAGQNSTALERHSRCQGDESNQNMVVRNNGRLIVKVQPFSSGNVGKTQARAHPAS